MNKKFFLLTTLVALIIIRNSSLAATGEVKWLTITQAEEMNKKSPKKFFIDIYTKWCGWCKRLDTDTYSDSAVAAYINSHFYPVKLDAETQDSVLYNRKKYGFNSLYHVNMVSYQFCDNSGYPTLSFLNANKEKLMEWPGYLPPADMLNLLKYFGDDYYKKYADYNSYLNAVVNEVTAPSVNPQPQNAQQGADVLHEGGKLVATTGTKYQWYDASGQIDGATSMVFIPAKTGTYYYVATDDNGNLLPPSKSVIFEFEQKLYNKAVKENK